MTQQNNEFEKWATKHIVSKRLLEFNTMKYENGMYKSHIMQRKFEAWQAATAESNKRIAELNSENKQIDAINASLQAHINVLRKALEYHTEQTRPIQKTIAALASTPAQSLLQHDNEVIERVVTILKDSAWDDGIIDMRVDDLIEDVRKLKA